MLPTRARQCLQAWKQVLRLTYWTPWSGAQQHISDRRPITQNLSGEVHDQQPITNPCPNQEFVIKSHQKSSKTITPKSHHKEFSIKSHHNPIKSHHKPIKGYRAVHDQQTITGPCPNKEFLIKSHQKSSKTITNP